MKNATYNKPKDYQHKSYIPQRYTYKYYFCNCIFSSYKFLCNSTYKTKVEVINLK